MLKWIKQRKAHSFVWLYIIVGIFAMGLLYIILDQPMNYIIDFASTNITGSRYATTNTQLAGIWNFWLVIFLLGILIFGILTTLKKENEFGY